ncbi:unnamed protein product [Closterium sp. NIES-65]|nr:unnamed protein product [Closterium sp. NIES-65]
MEDCCAVCAEPLEWVAIGPCGHRDVCSMCVARLRVVMNDQRCCICKQSSLAVVVTKALGDYTRTSFDFAALPSLVATPGRPGAGEYWYDSAMGAYFDDESHFKTMRAMTRLTCSICAKSPPAAASGSAAAAGAAGGANPPFAGTGAAPPGLAFRSLSALKDHLGRAHAVRMQYVSSAIWIPFFWLHPSRTPPHSPLPSACSFPPHSQPTPPSSPLSPSSLTTPLLPAFSLPSLVLTFAASFSSYLPCQYIRCPRSRIPSAHLSIRAPTVFLSEQRFYTRQQVERHEAGGDPEVDARCQYIQCPLSRSSGLSIGAAPVHAAAGGAARVLRRLKSPPFPLPLLSPSPSLPPPAGLSIGAAPVHAAAGGAARGARRSRGGRQQRGGARRVQGAPALRLLRAALLRRQRAVSPHVHGAFHMPHLPAVRAEGGDGAWAKWGGEGVGGGGRGREGWEGMGRGGRGNGAIGRGGWEKRVQGAPARRFYGDNELFHHMSTEHFTCHICQRPPRVRGQGVSGEGHFSAHTTHPGPHSSPRSTVSPSPRPPVPPPPRLPVPPFPRSPLPLPQNHFRADHHVCEDRECLEKKFVVFASEMELKVREGVQAQRVRSARTWLVRGRQAGKCVAGKFVVFALEMELKSTQKGTHIYLGVTREDRECLEKKFVVFASEMELKQHIAQQHAGNMKRAERNRALQSLLLSPPSSPFPCSRSSALLSSPSHFPSPPYDLFPVSYSIPPSQSPLPSFSTSPHYAQRVAGGEAGGGDRGTRAGEGDEEGDAEGGSGAGWGGWGRV